MKRLLVSPRIEQLDALLVFLGAEGGGDQRLGFAAREERRTVRARQHADFDAMICGSRRRRGRRDGGAVFSISSRKIRSFRRSKSSPASLVCSSATLSTAPSCSSSIL